jgi:hypothetical protein
MRTTVDIDSHLLRRLRAEAHRRGIAFKDLLHGLLRRGLDERPAAAGRYRSRTFAMGTPTPPISLDKALTLAATLEDDEVARELALRK